MKKSAELLKKLPDLVKETKENKLQWKIEFQTTEYNDPSEKPTEQIDGKDWLLDECFVSYHCEYKGKEFLLITYEQIASFEDKKKFGNYFFYVVGNINLVGVKLNHTVNCFHIADKTGKIKNTFKSEGIIHVKMYPEKRL